MSNSYCVALVGNTKMKMMTIATISASLTNLAVEAGKAPNGPAGFYAGDRFWSADCSITVLAAASRLERRGQS